MTITRVEPTGIDAELRQQMQEISGGAWTDGSFVSNKRGVALADDIVQVHPTSGYYPYILALRALRRAELRDVALGFDRAKKPAR